MMKKGRMSKKFLRFPVVSHGAEFLVQGYLMRRNILTYKAPPNNEGYDLICIHPNPRVKSKQVKVQVKSRLATDCSRGFPVRPKSVDAFDFLIVAFLNVGYFLRKYKSGAHTIAGRREPKFYTFPASFIKNHLDTSTSWPKVRLGRLRLEKYEGEKGFEQIARRLGIEYPSK